MTPTHWQYNTHYAADILGCSWLMNTQSGHFLPTMSIIRWNKGEFKPNSCWYLLLLRSYEFSFSTCFILWSLIPFTQMRLPFPGLQIFNECMKNWLYNESCYKMLNGQYVLACSVMVIIMTMTICQHQRITQKCRFCGFSDPKYPVLSQLLVNGFIL